MEVRTSETHPLRIDAVEPLHGWGLIGMSFCPGKKQMGARTGNWNRNLGMDLERLQAWGADIVVSLVEAHEFEELGVSCLPAKVGEMGMKWRHLPIRDMYPPGKRFQILWPELGKELVDALRSGRRIFLHCKGGLGRTGTVAACLLMESGMSADEAIRVVRLARRNTIETSVQEWFVNNYSPLSRPEDDRIAIDGEGKQC